MGFKLHHVHCYIIRFLTTHNGGTWNNQTTKEMKDGALF